MYEPKRTKPRPRADSKPLKDSVNILFDYAIDAVNSAEKEQGRKLAFIMHMQDKELEAQHQWDKHNTCPNCHIVLATSGTCDECGYVKPRGRCKNCAFNQESVCLNRKGSEGQRIEVNDLDRCDNWVKL
jgi:RNase P subunit RPR2